MEDAGIRVMGVGKCPEWPSWCHWVQIVEE